MRTLEETIENLYHAFSCYPRPKSLDGCPCCISDENIHILTSKKLREITPGELSSYASSAFLTVGDAADYMYFLPRIMEITATTYLWWPQLEVTGRAIKASGYDAWPTDCKEALAEFLHAYLSLMIHDNRSVLDMDSLLCAISKIGLSLQPYLERIENNRELIWKLCEIHFPQLHAGKLSNFFWEKTDSGYQDYLAWFQEGEAATVIAINTP